jgi:RNA polymerase sigma-70 factor, ECF subfamily
LRYGFAVTIGAPTHVEQQLAALRNAGQHDQATTVALAHYGPELLALLHARLRNLQDAREAYAWMAEDVWRGMARFRGQSSVRTWVYAIARNAASRYASRELRPRQSQVPISQLSRESALAVQLPSTVCGEDRIARLRSQLDADEQTLLTLRVDKNMEWRDVALVWLYDGSDVARGEEDIARETARLRKRFQLLKEKLRTLASSTP